MGSLWQETGITAFHQTHGKVEPTGQAQEKSSPQSHKNGTQGPKRTAHASGKRRACGRAQLGKTGCLLTAVQADLKIVL